MQDKTLNNQRMDPTKFPPEVIMNILLFMSFRDLLSLRRVNHEFDLIVFRRLVDILTRPTVQVIAGVHRSTLIKSDGTVWACGDNDEDQLGIGPHDIDAVRLEQVTGLTNIKTVAYGSRHSLALAAEGTVWTWGKASYGYLGLGHHHSCTTPQQVRGITDVIAVACGESHSLALKKDGTVWAWGLHSDGQLGVGYNDFVDNCTTPKQVLGITDVIEVACGDNHSLALKKDGTVWAFGANYYGQLGLGHKNTGYTPEQVLGLTNVRSVMTGGFHSFALMKNGTVWSWGHNIGNRLGLGHQEPCLIPQQVPGVTDVTALTVGRFQTFALRKDGSVVAWGDNRLGVLGLGDDDRVLQPTKIPNFPDVRALASGFCHTVAVLKNGRVCAWGDNTSGELGIDNGFRACHNPLPISKLRDVKTLSAGENHTLALKKNGKVVSWGRNHHGQLGLCDKQNTIHPQEVVPLGKGVVTKLLKGTICRQAAKTEWLITEKSCQALSNQLKSLISPSWSGWFFRGLDVNIVNLAKGLLEVVKTRDYCAIMKEIKACSKAVEQTFNTDKEQFMKSVVVMLEILDKEQQDYVEETFHQLSLFDTEEQSSRDLGYKG